MNCTFGFMNRIRWVKGSLLTFMVRSRHPFPILVKGLSRKLKTLHQSPRLSWVIRQCYKKVRSTGSVKRQKEREGKNISDLCPTIDQQVVQLQVNTSAEALDNEYAPWSCWTIIGCRSEMLFLSLSFCLWQIRCSEPFCTTVVWPMMMEAFDVMLSGKSVYVSRRTMAIEPMRQHWVFYSYVN